MKDFDINLFGLILGRLDGDRLSENVYVRDIERAVKDGIGGFVLFGGYYEEVKQFIGYLQKIAKKPLIIASDIERGVGGQIKGATLIPSQMGIAAGFDLIKDKNELETLYSAVVGEAIDVGINLALVPVLDVNTEPENPIISIRAFSDDYKKVSMYGSFLIDFFEKRGLPCCGKHFPGHGSTVYDSHVTLPKTTENIGMHIKPFKVAVSKKVSSIMVGHLCVPGISDSLPATLSEDIIQGLLRKKLHFKGAVLTDAMNMHALKDFEMPHAMALKAGADLIVHPEDNYEALKEVERAYKDKVLSADRIKEAIKRVDVLRKKTKNANFNDLSPIPADFLHSAFKKTVTVVRKKIRNLTSRKVVPYLAGYYSNEVKKYFKDYFGMVYELSEFRLGKQIPLFAVFTNIQGYKRQHLLKEYDDRILREITSKVDSILVSFGNPYAVKDYKEAKTLVLVYDNNELAVQAFLDAFKNNFGESGKLPINKKYFI